MRWLLAVGLVAAQLAGFAHLTFTAHRLCVEHGEWQEKAPLADRGADAVASVGAQWREAALPALAELSCDEHCSVLVRLRSTSHPGPTLSRLFEAVPAADAAAIAEFVLTPDAIRYRLAPKQSPPLA